MDGVGAISLPLLPAQAEQIIAVAERAPYGRGTETLLDTHVRRTWQIGADQLRISGKVWEQDLAAMVARAADGLGVTGPVEAELYKLLVYDTGSFFVRHRDSEKAPGMFATLVVVLPSDYSGGELLVRHKGHEVRLDLRRDEPSEAAFAAFYADCLHEVLPIASGYRLALIYNLIRKDKQPLPKPPDAFDDLDPEELDFQEATGNAGATFERLYQQAALVLWPRSGQVDVVSQGGLQASVPFLGELVLQWQASGAGWEDPLWQEAHRLAARIRRDWPDASWSRRRASDDGHTGALLRYLGTLGDTVEIDAFLAERTANGAYANNDNEALTEALGRVPPTRASELLTAIITHNAAARPAACANLLAHCTNASWALSAQMRSAAVALLRSLPDDKPHTATAGFGHRSRAPASEMVVDVLNALEGIDPELAARALKQFLSYPTPYATDEVLVPMALNLHESEHAHGYSSVLNLRDAVVAHLRRRIDEPLEPPADWRRPSTIACTCTYCRDLSRFLADPAQSTWLLKAAQAARTHVEGSIQSNGSDLDFVTEERGRPYTLRCTKNQGCYQRRVEQRRQDLEYLARLGGETANGSE